MEKVVIIGPSGSGKTTLAFNLAAKLDARAIDLDDLYWRPGWKIAPTDEFRAAAAAATNAPRWVAAGNYTAIRDIVWGKADTLIWLDYSLPRTFAQLARRSLTRIIDKQPICNGNTETLGKTFSDDGILYWMLRTYRTQRQDNAGIFAHPERHPGIRHFIRLRHPAETQALLDGPAIAPR